MIKCVLFDLDGVLVDATEWHYIALNQALKTISNIEISRQEHEITFNGWPTKNKLNELLKQNRININDIDNIFNLKQELTKKIIEENIKLDYDKIELHTYLKSKNIKIGCVTNCSNDTAKLMLEGTGQLEFFELLISNEMVKKPKPNSEGYVKAMVKLNYLPEETLIVEDSEKGWKAAEATGAKLFKVESCNQVSLTNILVELNA